MSEYLLDTCVVSELVKNRPNPKVVDWVSSQGEESLFLSVVTLGELQKGIRKCPEPRRKSELQAWLDKDLLARFDRRLLPVCERVSLTWGRLAGDSELRGQPLPILDLMLAATGVVHGLTLVTRNTRDLDRCSVVVFDPWA
ncbi:type II toxin-antitoxin system VapC family toxin [bacterium]|nr:type II toxin-antitoxin system VapC family toxin [bacterium]